MSEKIPNVADMEKQNIARFDRMKPFKAFFLDTAVPAYQRDIYNIIGKAASEDPNAKPAITGIDGVSMNYAATDPGKGSGLHSHPVTEIFIPFNSRWSIFWGDNGEHKVEIGPMDCVAVPPNVMRGFLNIGTERGILMAILPATDVGKIDWAKSLIEDAAKHGARLDAGGNMMKPAAE